MGKKKLFFLALSSMLGVGIFIKSKTLSELSHFQLWPILSLFCLAGVLIVSMTFVFTKLVNQHSLSGRSFIEWVEEYFGINFRNWAIRFTRDFAQPVGLITTSIYLISWVIGESFLWVWESAVISLVIGGAIATLNTFSFKWSEFLQRFLSFAIFITIAYFSTFGIISISIFKNQEGVNGKQAANQTGLNFFSGWTIMLSGLPSIFFMYDGFYSVLSLKKRAKSQIAFSRLILYAMCIVTILYFALIAISLLGDKKSGDFLNFYNLKNDKNLRDVLTILIMLTFLSSLNVSTICGSHQLLNLHLKYNFHSFNKLRTRILNRGKHFNKAGLENKLSVWLFLMKRIILIALIISSIAQLNYWISSEHKNIFWSINDSLAELNSLVIFFLLGIIICITKNKERKRWTKPFYSFSALCIFLGSAYYILNNIYSYSSTFQFIHLLKLLFLAIFITFPAYPWIKQKLHNIFKRKIYLIQRTNDLKGSSSLLYLGSPTYNSL